MPRSKDELPAVRIYTVCDESKYLIVRNVPALGCGDELSNLFASYGEVEECKPMDAEDCEPYTDVYWIKFRQVNNARFAKRKLDEYVFLGNKLQVSYASQFESLPDTKEKLEGRRREVLARLNPGRQKGSAVHSPGSFGRPLMGGIASPPNVMSQPVNYGKSHSGESQHMSTQDFSSFSTVSSDQEYFSSHSMNQTVRLVREKLNKIQSSVEHIESGPSKKARVDNRRRI